MIKNEMEFAFQWRKNLGLLSDSEALRLFYGPGESEHPELKNIAIDLFKDHAWITSWAKLHPATLPEVDTVLRNSMPSLQAVVWMDRSQVASEAEVKALSGTVRKGRFTVLESGIPYQVQMESTKHPGLFLDHAPLRRWLETTQQNKRVLNLFSYTGSLSVAAARGGAAQVTTLDLSKPTIEWAKENWTGAGLELEKGDFIYGDVFEWLPKLMKRSARFDTILCDPPSFSRTKSGVFSTNKDSRRLHELIFPLLERGGILVSSINSENYADKYFLKDIEAAAKNTQSKIRILKSVDLPESFPTPPELPSRYLKGFYLLKTE